DQRVFCVGSSTFQLLKGCNVFIHGPPVFGLSFSNSHAPSAGFAGDLAFFTLHWHFPRLRQLNLSLHPPSPASRCLRHTRISHGGGALAASFLPRPAVPVLFLDTRTFRNVEIWGNPMADDRRFSGLPNFHLTPRDSYAIDLIRVDMYEYVFMSCSPVHQVVLIREQNTAVADTHPPLGHGHDSWWRLLAQSPLASRPGMPCAGDLSKTNRPAHLWY
ncbi:hypothetical protein JMJ77_0002310, partial [Colletotrichum scovillei]